MITCVIQYTLDPHGIEEFKKYAARAALDPAELEQPGRDGGGQGAVEVPAALGPVEALPREVPP
jgi:hypothetical protein